MAITTEEHSPIDPIELRRAFGTFVTGVTVVTTQDENGAPRGMTANSFTSVSLDPPLLLVCIGQGAASYTAFKESDYFAVNILHENQTEVASLFASKSANKFANTRYDAVHTGAPVLSECLTWFDCVLHSRADVGDHMVLIGRVRAFGTSPAAPLGFCRGRYVSVKNSMPPDWCPSHRMVFGYLVEHEGRILLRKDADGWGLPSASGRRDGNLVSIDEGDALTLVSDEAFLYSVFDVADQEPGYIVYRGVLTDGGGPPSALPPSLRFFSPEELPWDQIHMRQIRGMLRRYLHERSEDRFGIYVDSRDGGRVAMIDGAPRPWRLANGVSSDPENSRG